MKERYLSKTPFLTFVYISKFNINLPCYFGNSKKRFLWTGLIHIVCAIQICVFKFCTMGAPHTYTMCAIQYASIIQLLCVCVRYVPWVHQTHSVLLVLPDIATHTLHTNYCVCVCVAADIHIVCCTMGAPNQPHPECAAHPRAPASAYSPQFLRRWANHAFVYLFFLLFPPPCVTPLFVHLTVPWKMSKPCVCLPLLLLCMLLSPFVTSFARPFKNHLIFFYIHVIEGMVLKILQNLTISTNYVDIV